MQLVDLGDVFDSWERGIAPPSRRRLPEWAESEMILSGTAASEPGPWRNARTPYLVEIMDRLSVHDPCRVVVVKAGAQTGKTSAGLNWIGYVTTEAPAPMMIVLPTIDTLKKVLKQRVDPMIESVPSVRAVVTKTKAKEDGSTQFARMFPGGMLNMATANAPSTLRSMPAQYLFLDEVDADIEEPEGDFIEIAMNRLNTFPRRKTLITSTPRDMSTSRIERWYRRGDQRVYQVPCPYCNHAQHLQFHGLKWELDAEGRPERGSVAYVCETCERRIEERWKDQMLPAGAWSPTAKGEDRTHSYWLPSFNSPLGWLSWHDIAMRHAEALRVLREERDDKKMRQFVELVEARGYEDSSTTSATEWGAVAERADDRPPGIVPEDVLVLTCGVDVQDDRLEAGVWGWAPGEEAYLVTHEVFDGDPENPETWAPLDDFLQTGWPTTDGREMFIASTAVDSGDGEHMQAVYAFTRKKLKRRGIFAVKGSSRATDPVIGKATLEDFDHKGVRRKDGVKKWTIGVHRIKKNLAPRLKITEPGPRMVHTPAGMTEEWYRQLCGEKLVTVSVRGAIKEKWVKVRPSQAVEAWDCFVYAYAAACRIGMDRSLLTRLAAEREETGRRPGPRPAPRPVVSAPVSAPVSRQTPVEPPRQVEGPAVRTVSSSPPPRQTVVRSRWVSRR